VRRLRPRQQHEGERGCALLELLEQLGVEVVVPADVDEDVDAALELDQGLVRAGDERGELEHGVVKVGRGPGSRWLKRQMLSNTVRRSAHSLTVLN
jgi:hypothetical protein